MVIVLRAFLPCADYYVVSRPIEHKLSANADINGDGKFTLDDINALINIYLQKQ